MSDLERALRQAMPNQLVSAIDEIPGLIIPVLVSFAVVESIPRSGSFLEAIPPVSFHLLAGCLAGLLGVIFYSWGDYWDRKWFNPRYGPDGSWSAAERPVSFRVFPSAENLVELRQAAAEKLLKAEAQESQKGVYAAAEALVRMHGRWGEVVGPVVLSKFARSFIWPSFLLCGALLVTSAIYLFSNMFEHPFLAEVRRDFEKAGLCAILAVISLAVGLLSFLPYAKFRVRHMEQLYRLATRLKDES